MNYSHLANRNNRICIRLPIGLEEKIQGFPDLLANLSSCVRVSVKTYQGDIVPAALLNKRYGKLSETRRTLRLDTPELKSWNKRVRQSENSASINTLAVSALAHRLEQLSQPLVISAASSAAS